MEEERTFPTLETERLVLRELTSDDVEWYRNHFSTPEIVHGSGYPAPADIDAAKEEFEMYILGPWKEGTGLRWGITLKDDGSLIGSCGFYKWESDPHRKAEIGYDLHPTYWGKGIMREALQAIIRYGFEEMNLNRITLLVISYNDRSIRLAERLGFVKEGVMRESAYFDGKFIDDVLYSLLRADRRGER
jgi:ribosomal-protein-alanine N-acetyltransferase